MSQVTPPFRTGIGVVAIRLLHQKQMYATSNRKTYQKCPLTASYSDETSFRVEFMGESKKARYTRFFCMFRDYLLKILAQNPLDLIRFSSSSAWILFFSSWSALSSAAAVLLLISRICS